MKTYSASDSTWAGLGLSAKFTVLYALCLMLALSLSPSGLRAQAPTSIDESPGPNRKNFTLLLTLGAGIQSDEIWDETNVGLGGLNLGIGGFLSPQLALMFRVSGTTVNYNLADDFGIEFDITQTSGVGGAVLQYWFSDRFNVECGPGLGFWTDDWSDETGFGFIAGAAYSLFQSSKVNLQLGLELAPVFTEGAVANYGINLGFQLL